jgi:hypothetical protein
MIASASSNISHLVGASSASIKLTMVPSTVARSLGDRFGDLDGVPVSAVVDYDDFDWD